MVGGKLPISACLPTGLRQTVRWRRMKVKEKSGYRAPEILQRKGTFNRMSDIWTLGCILHVPTFGTTVFENDYEAGQFAGEKKCLEIIFP